MEPWQARLARGDLAAMAKLYDTYADRIGHYLLVQLRSSADADDALQETFCRLMRIRRKLAKVENLEAYVFAVARNEAARLAAKNSRRRREQKNLASSQLFCIESNQSDLLAIAELTTAAMDRLEPELREIVELKNFAGLTFQQIAEVTGLPQGTTATRYRTALSRMRDWFARARS